MPCIATCSAEVVTVSAPAGSGDVSVAGRIDDRFRQHRPATKRGRDDDTDDRFAANQRAATKRGKPDVATGLPCFATPVFPLGDRIPAAFSVGAAHCGDRRVDFRAEPFSVAVVIAADQSQGADAAEMILIFDQQRFRSAPARADRSGAPPVPPPTTTTS